MFLSNLRVIFSFIIVSLFMPDLKFGKGEKNQTDAADYVFCSDPLKSLSTLLGAGKRRNREGVMRLSNLGATETVQLTPSNPFSRKQLTYLSRSDGPARGKPTLC